MSASEDINEGFVPIYATTITLKFANEEGKKAPEATRFKIFVRQTDDILEAVRFQLSKDDELNFLYECTYTEKEFKKMRREQQLDIDFNDFPNVVRQLVATIVKGKELGNEESQYKASFKDYDDPKSENEEEEEEEEEETQEKNEEDVDDSTQRFFIVYQRLEFCKVQIFKLAFKECPIERIEKIAQARYDELSAQYKAVDTEYKDIYKRIERQARGILATFKTEQE